MEPKTITKSAFRSLCWNAMADHIRLSAPALGSLERELSERNLLRFIDDPPERTWPRVKTSSYCTGAWLHSCEEDKGIYYDRSGKKVFPSGPRREEKHDGMVDRPDLDGITEQQFLALCQSGEMWEPWEYRLSDRSRLVLYRHRGAVIERRGDRSDWSSLHFSYWSAGVPITTAQALAWIEEHKPKPQPKPEPDPRDEEIKRLREQKKALHEKCERQRKRLSQLEPLRQAVQKVLGALDDEEVLK